MWVSDGGGRTLAQTQTSTQTNCRVMHKFMEAARSHIQHAVKKMAAEVPGPYNDHVKVAKEMRITSAQKWWAWPFSIGKSCR